MKKRAYPEQERIMNKRLSADSNSEPVNNTIVPDGEEFKVGEAVKDIQNIREGSNEGKVLDNFLKYTLIDKRKSSRYSCFLF